MKKINLYKMKKLIFILSLLPFLTFSQNWVDMMQAGDYIGLQKLPKNASPIRLVQLLEIVAYTAPCNQAYH